jgi:hypothetical protein
VAAVLAYRALVRLTGRPGASVGAAAAYVASAVLLWAFSQGQIGLLAVLVVLPPIVERLEAAFGDEEPADGRWRFVAGLAVTIAVGVAFEPGVLLALGLLLIVEVLAGTSRVRGVVLTLASVAGAAILLFSFLPTIATGDGAALRSEVGTTDPWRREVGGRPCSCRWPPCSGWRWRPPPTAAWRSAPRWPPWRGSRCRGCRSRGTSRGPSPTPRCTRR